MEYFKYMYDLLREKGAPHIKIFGGGGGVILPREIKELHEYGIAGIFSIFFRADFCRSGIFSDPPGLSSAYIFCLS